MTVLQLHRRASTRDTARRLRQHRPAHAVRLAALVIRVARCGLRLSPASASRPPPVSSPLKATPTACSARLPSPLSLLPAACCRPPTTTAPVKMSVMPTTLQHLDHCADSLRTGQVLARLVASGDIASLVPSDSLRSSSAPPLRVRFARCGLRCHRLPHYPLHLCPGHCSRLRQCARHDRLHYLPHSSPLNRRGGSLRRVLRRPFPFACAPGFFVPHRLRGLWFSHPTHLRCWLCHCYQCAPCPGQAPPSSAWALLDRVYALENRAYHIEFVHIS